MKDVSVVTEFLCGLLNASANKVSDISIEHNVIHWEDRQVLIHGQELNFLLGNKRLFLVVESISDMAEKAARLYPPVRISYIPPSSLPGCIIHGPADLELAALQVAQVQPRGESIYLGALRAAQEITCLEEVNKSASSADEAPIRENNNPAGTQYRSLFPLLYDSQSFRPICCNTSVPVPFKTEMFEGVALLRVNSSDDPAVKQDQTGWTFEVQVQGKFTRKPRGPLFIGAQISKKMVGCHSCSFICCTTRCTHNEKLCFTSTGAWHVNQSNVPNYYAVRSIKPASTSPLLWRLVERGASAHRRPPVEHVRQGDSDAEGGDAPTIRISCVARDSG